MSKIQIGKVALTYDEKPWSVDREYSDKTCVLYNGSSYVSLKTVKGIPPSNDGINWRLLASKGDRGQKGNDGNVSFNSLTYNQKKQIQGQKGQTGYHYIPHVSQEGILSWTNNGNLQNPSPVNIKGLKGDKGNPANTFYLQIIDGQLIMTTFDDSFKNLLRIDENGDLILNIE